MLKDEMSKKGSNGSGCLNMCSRFGNQSSIITILTISVVLYLVYEIWSLESERKPLIERNEALAKELARVLSEMEVKDRKLLILERKLITTDNQIKEQSQQLSDCKSSYNNVAKNSEDLRVKNEEFRKKAEELQTLLDRKMELIRSLAESSGSAGVQQIDSAKSVSTLGLTDSKKSTVSLRCHIWVGQVDTNSVNGIINREQTTLSGCQRHCIEVPECVAIDFDSTSVPNPTCWVHTNAKDLEQSSTYQQYGTTQHRLDRNCLKNST